MVITRRRLSKMLLSAARLWRDGGPEDLGNSPADGGEPGQGLGRMARLLQARVKTWEEDESLGDFLDGLGHGLMALRSGGLSSLYGAFFCGLAEPLSDEDEIDGAKLKEMLAEGLAAMKRAAQTRPGQENVQTVAAMAGAVGAAQAAGAPPPDILTAAARAARKPAAGAGQASAGLLFKGLAEGLGR